MSDSPTALPLGVFSVCAAAGGINPLTCTHFDPTIFLNFQKKVVVSHRANEPIYLAHSTSSDTSWKRATRAVTARHKGKRIAVSERKETTHG